MSPSPAVAEPDGPTLPDGGAARAVYERRLWERQGAVARLERLDRVIADARLAVFALALVIAWAAWYWEAFSWSWAIAPLLGYGALVVVHDQNRRRLLRKRKSVAFYEQGLRRLDGTWPGTGNTGVRFLREDHLYAADLDLFGVGSVFERFCTARTRAGEDVLARWLLSPAEPPRIRERQEAVVELRPRLDLREDLELIGTDVREGIDPEALAAWGREPLAIRSRWPSLVALALAVLAVASLLALALTDLGRLPFLVTILLEIGYWLGVRWRVRKILDPIQKRTRDLVILGELLARLENEPFEAPGLRGLREALQTDGEPASHRIARLARLLHLLDMKDHQLFAPIAGLTLWVPQLAFRIDAWRASAGPAIAGWLEAVGEFEALTALAAYSFEHPDDPFATIEERETCFEAKAVGHPLLKESTCVRNDVALGGDLRMLLISGSNMSGKSTLLRTVGVNTVLALAGAPVRARALRVSVLEIGATLRIQDSLQAGRSRFYAEITRVRELVEKADGPRPLLFLLDEIFHGTNSHDRVIGARGVVAGLLARGAIGLVTTHDLALAEVAEHLAPKARNVHFEDQLVDGVMRFDYQMRPGIVTHSNALALMRAVGLDV
ncbi:MAG: DNA mismatch repair protein MutS [Isosphaeraceae bacterium]